MYAFLCADSAIEVIRHLSARGEWEGRPAWPDAPRLLPVWGECVCNQRSFREYLGHTDLGAIGVVSRPVDLLVPSSHLRSAGKSAKFRVWSRPVPTGSCRRLACDLVVCGPEFAITQLAGSFGKFNELFDDFAAEVHGQVEVLESLGKPDEFVAELPHGWEQARRLAALAATACELAGTYRLQGPGQGVAYDAAPVMTTAGLREFAATACRGPASARARAIAELALDGSASPMETALALLLTMPVELGGFGIKKPLLNMAIDASVLEDALRGRDSVTPDMLWPEKKVALEYDSSEFHARKGAQQAERDAARSNVLSLMGYRVLRATTRGVSSLPGVALLARQIAFLLEEPLREPTPLEAQRRSKLFGELMPRLAGE